MSTNRRGFTLIELLVVIAIIALLVTLLVPALQEAKHQAKVVICSTNLRGYAMGLIMYGSQDDKGIFPPHDRNVWGNVLTIWSSQVPSWSPESVYPVVFPDKTSYLTMFRDEICSGNFQILWCPFDDWYYNPYHPRYIGETDPKYPGLWYDSRFAENYMGGYARFANLGNADFTYSRNTQTDEPPLRPGNSRDAILADDVHCSDSLGYTSYHMGWPTYVGEEALKLRRENDVAYGDGHVEVHNQKAYFEGQHVMWDGAGWVPYWSERIQY